MLPLKLQVQARDEAVGDEKIDAMAHDEEGIIPAQDEEDNAPNEAAGTTYIVTLVNDARYRARACQRCRIFLT